MLLTMEWHDGMHDGMGACCGLCCGACCGVCCGLCCGVRCGGRAAHLHLPEAAETVATAVFLGRGILMTTLVAKSLKVNIDLILTLISSRVLGRVWGWGEG